MNKLLHYEKTLIPPAFLWIFFQTNHLIFCSVFCSYYIGHFCSSTCPGEMWMGEVYFHLYIVKYGQLPTGNHHTVQMYLKQIPET